ncbi:uncharacterized protein STEHIDRAFT_160857 [Stereum hirsutum FP-91666 SS1]|uniref:uncharacterized protein n=1 Tax=Stereum hirsutum (strain FP-91666) TaxID=721885 RepID=UPI00044495FA|nr:uncharacterized protein STEHIDRAFT_160857 [Stereum hirsutum FP-91666 SS1]EIM82308.1 hypothetical protein STEHIDRAFT_160857 [Stereum hirsutum FP-91666 SS1]
MLMESALDILANLALSTGTALDDQGPNVGILGPPGSPNGGSSSDADRGGLPGKREQWVLESRGAFIDPLSAPLTALTIQHEKMCVSEALAARDAVVHHLELACRSVREKAVTIEELRSEKEHLEGRLEELNGGAVRKGARGGDVNRRRCDNDTGGGEVDGLRSDGKNESTGNQTEVERLRGVIASLQVELQELKDRTQKSAIPEIDREQPPLAYEDQAVPSTLFPGSLAPPRLLTPEGSSASGRHRTAHNSVQERQDYFNLPIASPSQNLRKGQGFSPNTFPLLETPISSPYARHVVTLDSNDLDYKILSPTRSPNLSPHLLRHHSSTSTNYTTGSSSSSNFTPYHPYDEATSFHLASEEPSPKPEDLISARHEILAALPLPEDVPSDVLRPIVVPTPLTMQEWLSGVPLRPLLQNYRILQELTTTWCPAREEHGYFLTPVFKCTTNPRVTTAHRWTKVDVLGRMAGGRGCECFYNKDGKWYYAGTYTALRLADLTPKEFEQLSTETTQLLIRETISSRKNTSPQNIFEVTQLYACGALKVACVGLQCIGFNRELYEKLQELGQNASHAGPSELSGQGIGGSSVAGGAGKSPGMPGAGGSGRPYGGQGGAAHSPGPSRSPGRSPHLRLNLNLSPGLGLSIDTPTRRGAGARGGPPSPLGLQFPNSNPSSSPMSQIPMGPWNSMSGVHVGMGMGSPGGPGAGAGCGRGMLSATSPMGGMVLGMGVGGGARSGAGMEGNQNVLPGSGGV